MKEEEAKTKWCPMACSRVLNYSDARGDKKVSLMEAENGFTTLMCLASGCMAWVWRVSPEQARKQSGMSAKYQQDEDGHCGLAK